MSPMQADAWQDGDLYEPYVGRWSRVVASQFVDWLDVPSRRTMAGRGMRHRRALRDRPRPRRTDRGPRHRSVRRVREVRRAAPGRPEVRGAGRRRSIAAVRRRVVRRGRLRVGAELHRRSGRRGEGARAGRGARRHRGRLRLGLRRRDADDALLLGRGEGHGSRGARTGRGRAVPGARVVEGARRSVRTRGAQRRAVTLDRHPHDLPGLRRLLGAVPRGPGTGAGVLRVARRKQARRAARAAPRQAPHEDRRHDPSHRPRVGRPGAAPGRPRRTQVCSGSTSKPRRFGDTTSSPPTWPGGRPIHPVSLDAMLRRPIGRCSPPTSP